MELTVQAIEAVLDEKVRPELKMHGGDIRIAGLENGFLIIRLTGKCMNCPSAQYTLEHFVKDALANAFPEIRHIELVAGVSDSLLDDMHMILGKRRESRRRM